MAVYGVVYAVLENDARRLLAYHIISQVGYMVCGVGIGTPLALKESNRRGRRARCARHAEDADGRLALAGDRRRKAR